MEKEESIDLREIMQIVLQYKKELGIIVAVCTAVAMITAFFILPKTYESTTLVRAKSQTNAGLSAAAGALAMLGGGGNVSAPTMIYTELMKSRAVIDPIIQKVDMPEEVREKMTAKAFAKGALDIKNTKGTDLIEITATGKTPEEAQMISSEVINGFLHLMTQLNQNEQSLMVKFLSDRITVAKADMEKAEQELEKFRQQEKIYVPDEQVKASIEKLSGYDKLISELKVRSDSSEVRLQEVRGQLNKQNIALKEFNIADNESIQKIRDNIIDKQIQLVEAEQRYTDKHPNVTLLKQEIVELNARLSQEVSQSVDAGTNTMNPIHAGLLSEKVQTETELMVTKESLNVLQGLQGKAEEEISKLSTASMEYVKLQRDTSVAQEVYSVLVKNYENARIQEAMDSMDIQVVDAAELPKQPAGPRKLLITAIGGVLGIMISFGYTLVLYNRRNSSSKLSV